VVNIYRLIRAFALLLLAFCSLSAFADGGPFAATPGEWNTSSCNATNYPGPDVAPGGSKRWVCEASTNGQTRSCGWYYSSPDYGVDYYKFGACTQYKAPDSCPAGASASTGSSGESLCTCTSGLIPFNGQCVSAPTCPEGQHEEGGACVPNSCKANETRVNGVCVPEPACPAGETRVNGVCQKSNCKTGATGGYYDMTSTASVGTCSHDGAGQYCSMIIEHSSTAHFPEGARYYGIGRLTGTSCAPAPDGPGSPTPTDPPKPLDPNAPKPTQPATPGAPAGGSPGQTRPGSSPGTDGNCPPDSYKSNGSCYPKNPPPEAPDSDGKCPVGTIKVGSVCAVLQPAPDKEPGEEEKKPSVFGGACNAVACEGDAIQCAIARDQYRRSCELMEKESAESQLYTSNKSKEGNQTGNLPGNETINLAGRIDTSDALGAGSAGVSDLSVTVLGQSITLPFSMLNPYLAALGNVLLAVSFLIALRIVARG